MSMGIVAESVVPWSICTVHPAAPAAADTVFLSPAILATVPTAVPAPVPTAVPATVSTAVPANVPKAIPANVPAAVPATVHTAVPLCSCSCPCYCSYSCPFMFLQLSCYCSYSCPCYCSYSCPCYCSYSCPATVPTDVPATVPTDVPATVPTDVPATVPTDVPSCNADYGCWDHIFQVLSLLGIQANSDMNHLPSAKDRKVARVKEDLTEDGFRRVKPLFWKGVKGWIKVLLPAWNLPDDKVLKKLFSLPSGPFEGQMLKEQVPLMITPWLQRISSKPSNRRNCYISFVSGCVASMSTSFTSADSPTFECKVDWAQTRKAMLPEFSSKV